VKKIWGSFRVPELDLERHIWKIKKNKKTKTKLEITLIRKVGQWWTLCNELS